MKNENIFSDGREARVPPEQEGLKERLYAKVKIPLKTLDGIIWALGTVIVILIVGGALKGNGIL